MLVVGERKNGVSEKERTPIKKLNHVGTGTQAKSVGGAGFHPCSISWACSPITVKHPYLNLICTFPIYKADTRKYEDSDFRKILHDHPLRLFIDLSTKKWDNIIIFLEEAGTWC